MSPQDYMRELVERLEADGCDPHWDTTGAPFLIGRRTDFRIRALAPRLHLFVIAAVLPEITLSGLEQFTGFAMNTAIRRSNSLTRGLQSGIAVFPALISDRVEPAAMRRARVWQRARFAAIGRPTVVDTADRAVGAYRGTPVVGLLHAAYLRRKHELYFPPPR
jgi:hypothetical protein